MRRAVVRLALLSLTIGLFALVGCKSGPTEQEIFDKATAAQEQSDFPSAIKAYEELVQKYPKSGFAPKCQFMIGYLYANHLKDEDKARAAYQVFIKNYPEDNLVKDAQWELDHLGQDVNQIDELNKLIGTPDSTEKTQG
ncbi:MAG: tetratricopeptide repeat protein [Calditrichaeota bacterium]|nr:tetratricopeptide repeat protein [Calditrichota bacterium]MCB9368416.1 tetratricopeptide repeat protein [Calditrichota bacterium]